MKKIVNGIEVEMTPAEIEEFEAGRIKTPEQIKAEKKELNAAARYIKEISGIDYNGHFILTEREDINILNSAMEKIRRGLVESIEWKCGDGSYLVLNSSNIAEIELLVLSHIQGSFAKEKYYNDLIDQGVEVEFIY